MSRALIGLDLASETDPPLPGTALFSGEQRIGRLTSSTVPPGWKRPIALGYVKRKWVEPGSTLTLDKPGAARPARVVELPFEPGT